MTDRDFPDRASREALNISEAEEQRLLHAQQQWMFAKASTDGKTQKLQRESSARGSAQDLLDFGATDAQNYIALPVDSERRHPDHIRWRVELHGLEASQVAGLDILGDVVLGCGSDPDRMPDLDLSPYGAYDLGVSRQHAVLKPTPYSLYLMDLRSTNGTQYNGLPMAHGLARSLANNDVICLGKLCLQIKIIDTPLV